MSIDATIEEVFTRIEQDQMEGVPILNRVLKVEAVDFQPWDGRQVGVIVTPWLMALMIISDQQEEWDSLVVGDKYTIQLPSKEYEMMVNEFDDIGRCLTFSLHSPMNEFDGHMLAVAVARSFMEVLLVEVEGAAEQSSSEKAIEQERLDRFLEGEDMAEIYRDELESEAQAKAAAQCQAKDTLGEREITRRDLLRGKISPPRGVDDR